MNEDQLKEEYFYKFIGRDIEIVNPETKEVVMKNAQMFIGTPGDIWNWFSLKLDEIEKEHREEVGKSRRDGIKLVLKDLSILLENRMNMGIDISFSDLGSWIEIEKINAIATQSEGCPECKNAPFGWIQVDDVNDPHCKKCGRKIIATQPASSEGEATLSDSEREGEKGKA